MAIFDKFKPLADAREMLAQSGVEAIHVVMDRVVSATEAVVDRKTMIKAGTHNYHRQTFKADFIHAAFPAAVLPIAAVVAVSEADRISPRLRDSVAQDGRAFREDRTGRIGQREDRVELRAGVGRGVDADLVAGRGLEAEEVHVAGAVDRAHDGRR